MPAKKIQGNLSMEIYLWDRFSLYYSRTNYTFIKNNDWFIK